jgi:tetratricopeptide (TPR) repeat protein
MFFEKFREAVGRYADGVHELGDALGRPPANVPPALGELYVSWNGLRLFTDSFVIVPAAEVAAEGDFFRIGEALGVPLYLDGEGRIYEADERGDRLLAGSSVEKWLEAVMAREALLVDRVGEWKDVFAEGELIPEVRRKRARAGLKIDPDSAVWHLEAAELAFEEGDGDEAEAALRRAVAADAQAGGAWALLGGIERRAGRLDEAEEAFRRAAEATRDRERAGERWGEAARAAHERGGEAAAHAERALEAAPTLFDEWLAKAKSRLDDGDAEGALNLATLADAVRSTPASAQLVSTARARSRLRILR